MGLARPGGMPGAIEYIIELSVQKSENVTLRGKSSHRNRADQEFSEFIDDDCGDLEID